LGKHLCRIKLKVLHIITGLGLGGAELTLSKLLQSIDPVCIDNEVISLTADGPVGQRMRSMGTRVTCLNMPQGRLSTKGLWQLWRIISNRRPEVVQTWLYHADLLGGVMAALAGVPCICWNIRNTNLDAEKTRWHTRQVVRACALISSVVPSLILCNSYRSAQEHRGRGYAPKKFRIIPNGFDVQYFHKNSERRMQLRGELGFLDSDKVIAHIGRFDPQKNHIGLLQTFSTLAEDFPNVHLLCCGSDIEFSNPVLLQQIEKMSNGGQVHLLGQREDIPDLLSACDLFVLPSHGESFPNVIGEAMACEIPCLVTDVGDCAEIVSDTGWVVPVNDPSALVSQLRQVLALPVEEYQRRGRLARQRVIEKYELKNVVRQYQELYLSLVP